MGWVGISGKVRGRGLRIELEKWRAAVVSPFAGRVVVTEELHR
jgi:hypothetical protein